MIRGKQMVRGKSVISNHTVKWNTKVYGDSPKSYRKSKVLIIVVK